MLRDGIPARNIAGTGVDSLAAGGSIYVVGGSAEEGDETSYDISIDPTRVTNYTTIIRKVVKLSGTARAVRYGVDRGDQLDAQSERRLLEAMRDLEKVHHSGHGHELGGRVGDPTRDERSDGRDHHG